MSKVILSVSGISCQHCVRAIEQAIGEYKGAEGIIVDLDKKEVQVTFDETQMEIEQIIHAIEEAGYDVEKKQVIGV